MKIVEIKESGCNNILMWALSNKADIKEDRPLISLINDETFYLVKLTDVNFLELFRLTQLYREKMRICNEYQATIPAPEKLAESFPGEYVLPNGESKTVPFVEIVEHVTSAFMSLTKQMIVDDDIINQGVARLFIPMLCRRFDVQIPISFVDLINSMNSDETSRLFSNEYPSTLQAVIDGYDVVSSVPRYDETGAIKEWEDVTEHRTHGVNVALTLGFAKGTNIIKHDPRYDKYLGLIKYFPLKNCQTQNLCKFKLLGFYKRDNVVRTEVRCNLFKPHLQSATMALQNMSRLNTPLELEFTVQLPIEYMQLLENSFSREVLTVAYESSMANIIQNGLIFNDFKTLINDENPNETHVNKIEGYKTRLVEAVQLLMNALSILLEKRENQQVDETNTFAMLPSVYMTNAVIKFKADDIQMFVSHIDPVISNMFQEISTMADSVKDDIRKAK